MRRPRARQAVLLVAISVSLWLITTEPLTAAPITSNTALPVGEGEGIVRLQLISLRSGDDPSGMDRTLEVDALPVVGAWGVTRKLALFGIVPVVQKKLDVNTPLGRRQRTVSGVGDVTLLARYTSYQRDGRLETFRVSPFIAIEAPTGTDDERDELGTLPQPLQLGSGSWDVSVGTVLTRQTIQWQIDSSLSFRSNGKANDFELGDEGRFDFSYQRRVFPGELGEGVPAFVYAVMESNLIWQDHNELGGSPDPDSGGVRLYLAPGIQWVTRRLIIEGAVQIPVLQDLNGDALENDFISTLSARMNF